MSRRAWLGGRELRVGPKRFDLLAVLALHPDGVTKAELLSRLWPGDGLKALEMTLHRLRRDLGAAAAHPIELRGGAYRLSIDPPAHVA